MIGIVILDETEQDPSWLRDIAEAVTIQSAVHFAASPPLGWGIAARVRVGASKTDFLPGEIKCRLLDHTTVEGALGFHDAVLGVSGIQVFPGLIGPMDLPVTISHEVCELLADPEASTVEPGEDGKIRAREVCDPCEQETYKIIVSSGRSVQVSDFVTPMYFTPPDDLTGIRYDYLGRIKRPYELLTGGYQSYYDAATGQWSQVMAEGMRWYRAKLAAMGLGRHARRVARDRVTA